MLAEKTPVSCCHLPPHRVLEFAPPRGAVERSVAAEPSRDELGEHNATGLRRVRFLERAPHGHCDLIVVVHARPSNRRCALTKEMLGLEAGLLGSYVRQNSARGYRMRHKRAWTMAAEEARPFPSADPGGDRVLGHEVPHRDVLIRLRSIIEEDLEAEFERSVESRQED